tara:strand:+ start:95 stop:475 length:381 start_codon:yes stop_codon:yes gene_type:complete
MINNNKGKKEMTKYKIYQPQIDRNNVSSEIDQAWQNVVFQHDLSQEELQLNVDKLIENVYKHTGSIDANNLDEVFHIGNTDRSKVTTTDIPFGSVSVGDIILDTETLETNIVARFGFTSVNVKEIA